MAKDTSYIMHDLLLRFLALLTLLTPFLLGIVGAFALKLRHTDEAPRLNQWMGYATVGVSFLVLLTSLILAAMLAQRPTHAMGFSLPLIALRVDFHIDALSLFFILLVNIIAFVTSWNAFHYLRDRPTDGAIIHHPLFFHATVNLFHGTMLLVPMVDNLIGLWIAIEATTLVSALLVSFQNTRNAWESAWKYLIITSTGIIFALMGTMFLAHAAETLIPYTGQLAAPNSVMNWTFLLYHAEQLEPHFVELSFLFILVGYGTKAGFAPMHTWLPDGHGEAPSPISALLSGVLLKSALYAILRFYTITNAVLDDSTHFTSTILLGTGLFSLLAATPFILKENRFKRVLAYHSLEHMGIITFGVGIGGPIALFGALLHTLNHAITKSLMFLSFGNILHRYNAAYPTPEPAETAGQQASDADPEHITGVLRSMPITGAILTLGGLALVGTPPFNIFLSEFIILWGALRRLWEPLAPMTPAFPAWAIIASVLLFLLSTTLIFYGLVRHLAKLVLHRMPDEQRLTESTWDIFPLALLALLVCLSGLWIYPPLSALITRSVAIIMGS